MDLLITHIDGHIPSPKSVVDGPATVFVAPATLIDRVGLCVFSCVDLFEGPIFALDNMIMKCELSVVGLFSCMIVVHL